MRPILFISFALSGLLSFSMPGLAGATAPQPDASRTESGVRWLDWDEEAFRRAAEEDKLILLDLTAVWCHACHVMDETTYADSVIVTLLNSQFIPVRVDTDRRPDVESRYRSGGWPTTSILLPTGEILFQANSLGPEELREALQETRTLYRSQKDDLLSHANDVWKRVEKAKKERKPPSQTGINGAIVEQAVEIMKSSFDPVNGGFRDAPKFFEPKAIDLAFLLDDRLPQESLKKLALFTLEKQQKLIDPVWGGFYRYATEANWSHPHYEKMLDIQALNLLNYLEAYQVTGEERYKKVVDGIVAYVTRFLTDRKNGGFYASQDAVVRVSNPSDRLIPGEEYFSHNEKDRLTLGMPRVDRSVYTGWNALMALSYLKVSQVLGKDQLLDFALKTLNHLWKERYRSGQGMAHVVSGGQPESFGWLDNQVQFASALIAAFVSTGEDHYLKKAEQLADYMVGRLEDVQAGGFYDRPVSSSDRGLLKFPSKPLEANIHTAILFCDLYYLTAMPAYRQVSERTLRYVLHVAGPLPMALTALAVDRFLRYPVHIVIVGARTNRKTRGLFRQGLRLYSPGKIVRILDPQRDVLSLGEVTFPKLDEPRAYVCTDKLCSAPVGEPEGLEPTLRELLTTLNEAHKRSVE